MPFPTTFMWHVLVHSPDFLLNLHPKNTAYYLFTHIWKRCIFIYMFKCVPASLRSCVTQEELHYSANSNGPVLLRRKRMAQAERNTCQLFIQTDHLFYKYYKTREAVIAQVVTS